LIAPARRYAPEHVSFRENSGDPLADVKILENVGFVMKDGKVFKNDLGPKR